MLITNPMCVTRYLSHNWNSRQAILGENVFLPKRLCALPASQSALHKRGECILVTFFTCNHFTPLFSFSFFYFFISDSLFPLLQGETCNKLPFLYKSKNIYSAPPSINFSLPSTQFGTTFNLIWHHLQPNLAPPSIYSSLPLVALKQNLLYILIFQFVKKKFFFKCKN